MSSLTLASTAVVAAFVAFVGVGVACTSEPESGQATYCTAAKTSWRKCTDRTACDDTLAEDCATLEKALSPSTLKATQDCLESGVCGNAGCLTRAPKSSTPTQAHRDLATSYCTTCAPDVADCEDLFYAKKGKLPGVLVLPYGETVATAVNQDCTADAGVCRSTFATCAAETIARVVGDTLGADLADCVVGGFRIDDDGAASGPGSGPQITTCTSANCNGCCRDDKCEEGAAESACGTGAAACETCSGAQLCTAGKCKEPCGPNNCAGCCDGDTCRAGTEATQCGNSGLACDLCVRQGASFICSNQTCIDGSCQATCTSGCCSDTGCQPGTAANACGTSGRACIDCGYGRSCGSKQACELDLNSTWDFYVSSAVLPDKNKSGSSWDPRGGAPDPYVVAYSSIGSSSHTGETSVKDNTHHPLWGESVLKGIKASELLNNLSFEIWDSDFNYDDFVGGCSIKLTASSFTGFLNTQVCPATASTSEVTLYYRIKKPAP